MKKSICEKCFHFDACKEIDVTGAVGNPECEIENQFCYHFIDRDRVKIEDKAHWIEKHKRYSDGDVHLTHHCSYCGQLERVKCYNGKEWNDYYHEHYRDTIELPRFCKICGSVVQDIFEEEEE
jgi:hypothetical protein